MTLTTFSFFAFLLVSVIAYYLAGRYQKYILLLSSLFFYISVSSMEIYKTLLLIAYVTLVTYFAGILIEKTTGAKRKVILSIAICALVALLVVLKYLYNMAEMVGYLFDLNADFSMLKFVSVIGLSYYSLAAIGYLIEVSWESYKAEKNVADVALFIFFFPQIISGPVTRYKEMSKQFNEKHELNYDNIVYGIRRMLWGYLKKLVISERFGIAVRTIYSGYYNFSGGDLFIATLCYAVQLYTDFTGCMDIIIGAARLFGIELPENFNAPFCSASIQEFWQRWHITLGLWFKDYVMYPIQKSKGLIKLGKKSKKLFGKKIGKKIPFYISMLALWFFIGIWHGGTGYYFVASAVVPFCFLFLSDVLNPMLTKISFKSNSKGLVVLRRVRTLLIVCVCWVFVCAQSVSSGLSIFQQIFCNPLPRGILSAMQKSGIGYMGAVIMVLGVIILIFAEELKFKGSSIKVFVDRFPVWFRIVIIYFEIIAIMYWGELGTSSFIYFKF